MSNLNRAAWRAAVRQAYKIGDANPQHRGAWGNTNGIYRHRLDDTVAIQTSWPHFGMRGGLTIQIDETYSDDQTTALTYTDATPPSTITDSRTGSLSVNFTILEREMLLLGSPEEVPSNIDFAYRFHSSACAYGEGLYDVEGVLGLYAPTRITATFDRTGYPGLSTDLDETETEDYFFRYKSDCTAIAGLNTPTRVTHPQYHHGPAAPFWGLGDEFLPLEMNPDGETYDELMNPQVEVYWTDLFLQCLMGGVFTDDMNRLSGSLSHSYSVTPPTATYDVSHDWLRSGTLTLTINP